MQKVVGDRIFENGKEVIWRSAGGSYLFHEPDRYLEAWQLHLPQMKAMGLNAQRLGFTFPDSQVPSPPTSEVLDYLDLAKMDQVLDFLSQNGIKGILNCFNWRDMYGDFGSQKLRDDWKRVAQHYAGDDRVAAYELFNEPGAVTWDPSIVDNMGVAREYATLTDVVRAEDPDHIVSWTVQWYFAYGGRGYFDERLKDVLNEYGRPNMVCTGHHWPHMEYDFRGWDPELVSWKEMDWHAQARKVLGIPQWVGEVGALNFQFNYTNPEYAFTERMLWRCEQQAIGWELHMGPCYLNRPWNAYLPFFPLKIYNPSLIRQPWNPPMPTLRVSGVSGSIDQTTPWYLLLQHDGDLVTLAPGTIIKVVTFKKDLTKPWPYIEEIVRNEVIEVKEATTIVNHENTAEFPGDYDTEIYSLYSLAKPALPLLLLVGSSLAVFVLASKLA